MKVWKSPIFYFGLLLLIAVTGAMAAPFVIDWNSYRADLEIYGRKLTGRTVNIDALYLYGYGPGVVLRKGAEPHRALSW